MLLKNDSGFFVFGVEELERLLQGVKILHPQVLLRRLVKLSDFCFLGFFFRAQLVNLLERQIPKRHAQEVIVRPGDVVGDELAVFVEFGDGTLVGLGKTIIAQSFELSDEFLLLLAVHDKASIDDSENKSHLVRQALQLRLGETNEHFSALRVCLETQRNERL